MPSSRAIATCCTLALVLAGHWLVDGREIVSGGGSSSSSGSPSALGTADATGDSVVLEASPAAAGLQQQQDDPAAFAPTQQQQRKSSGLADSNRRLMQPAGGAQHADADAQHDSSRPKLEASKFAKIAVTMSKPLGTALNGSSWHPGPCGPHPSALGYQCSWVTPGGAVLHWTYSTESSSPPINRCTLQPQALPNLEITEFNGPTVHYALQAASTEKLHLAFLDPEGCMFPSEGVHGRAIDPCNNRTTCKSTSTPQVEVLYHSTPTRSWSTGRVSARDPTLMEGWAAWASADTEGQTQVLCLSRHVHSKLSKLGSSHNKEMLLAYAVGDARNFMGQGRQRGMVSVDLNTGKATQVNPPTSVLLAHAVLMLVAFGVLLPAGLLLARHKWLFVSEEQGLNPIWALAHFVILVLSALVGVTGMIVALVTGLWFGSVSRVASAEAGLVMSTHQVLGLLSVAMSLVLVAMYGLRPFLVPGHKYKPSPLLGPQKVGGVVTVAAGWTSVFLGCVVIHQAWAAPYLHWLLPSILVTALVACAAVLLELRYQKLVRSGAYNPRTCTLSNNGPAMPLARIRTHREPTKPKKEDPDSLPEAQQRDSPMITAIHGSSSSSELAHTSSCNVAAAILSRSIGIRDSDGAPGSRGSSVGGRGSSAGGAGAELLFRRARHSTPNAAAASQVQTGFPTSPQAPIPHDTA